VIRRRERIAVLALWRHLSLSVPVAVIAIALSFPDRLEQLGRLIAERLPRVPLVADVIDWLRELDAIAIDPPVLPAVDLYPAAALLGLATLQAIVLIAILQLVAAPVAAFHAYKEGSPQRNAVFAVEAIVAVALLASVVPLFLAPDHGRFLGAGLAAWIPGIVATGLILAFVLGGSEAVRRSGAPAANRLFGIVATITFLVALASTLVTIFERDGLEMAELGYVAIWIGFLVLYRIGHSRWSQWDRVEREAAYHQPGVRAPSRLPPLISSIGFLVALAALVAYVFAWERQLFEALVAIALGLIGFAVVIGAISWSRHSDTIAAPPPVGSARGF
jgi:hypothetical protein